MTVLEFIKSKATFHSEMHYLKPEKSFAMNPCKIKTSGIYFILHGDDILKVGKAEGKHGIQGRLWSYRSNLSKRKDDKTVQLFEKVMTKELKDRVLNIYFYETPPVNIKHEGFELQAHYARSLEIHLSKQAKCEGHSLLLTGQH
jgi:hypothetical protein